MDAPQLTAQEQEAMNELQELQARRERSIAAKEDKWQTREAERWQAIHGEGVKEWLDLQAAKQEKMYRARIAPDLGGEMREEHYLLEKRREKSIQRRNKGYDRRQWARVEEWSLWRKEEREEVERATHNIREQAAEAARGRAATLEHRACLDSRREEAEAARQERRAQYERERWRKRNWDRVRQTSAVVIQRWYRKSVRPFYWWRRWKEGKSAIVIQKWIRGTLARLRLNTMSRAAKYIQKFWRKLGVHNARRKQRARKCIASWIRSIRNVERMKRYRGLWAESAVLVQRAWRQRRAEDLASRGVARAVAKWQQQILSRAFESWLAAQAFENRKAMVMLKVTRRLQFRTLHSAFSAWSFARAQRVHRAALLAKVALRIQRLHTIRSFLRWQELASESKRLRLLSRKAEGIFDGRRVRVSFAAWFKHALREREARKGPSGTSAGARKTLPEAVHPCPHCRWDMPINNYPVCGMCGLEASLRKHPPRQLFRDASSRGSDKGGGGGMPDLLGQDYIEEEGGILATFR
mmetsp:Transcript_38592/g.122317  ORF Transcript_38592/g.122317 Transcript_38592/m.122317 type:complete len:524 (-) Transcript_38592:8079-9650(-)